MKKLDCPFCEEQINLSNNILKRNRIIAETQNFIVFPTTGGFVDNYQLIVPKEHINCFGELSSEQVKELKYLIAWQQKINKKYFNMNTSMFEHGALQPSGESGKSIVHAHLHVFPNNISLLNFITRYNFGTRQISDISSLKQICSEYTGYLYYSDKDGKDYIMSHEGIPSQFLRKVLAESRGIEKWNWRENPFVDAIEENLKFYEKNSLVYNERKEVEE